MARYPSEHKQATRQRIMESAAHRFKQDGIDGAGIAAIMKDAGLTNGAFYAHFGSKDELVTEVVAEQLAGQRQAFRALAEQCGGVEGIVRLYLSPEHRDDRADGCPSAALLDEIGRLAEPARQAYTTGLLELVDDIAGLAPDGTGPDRVTVLGTMAMLIGTLQLSRALTDTALADELLDNALGTALAALDGRDRP